jgi:gamma-glutamylcyclotransferase (GGCT)/AIG2-like uncharacterized protein YtfP
MVSLFLGGNCSNISRHRLSNPKVAVYGTCRRGKWDSKSLAARKSFLVDFEDEKVY